MRYSPEVALVFSKKKRLAQLLVLAALAACGRTDRQQPSTGADGDGRGGGTDGAAGGGTLEPAPSCAIALDGGGGRHCAVYQDGSVWCWGVDRLDGPGNFAPSAAPLQVEGLSPATRVYVGPRHTCAFGEGFECWGDNESAQINDSGASPLPPTPLELGPSQPVAIASVGLDERQTCIVDYLAHVYCRGTDASGEPRNSTQVDVAGNPGTTMPGPGTEVIDERGRIFGLGDWENPQPYSLYGTGNESFDVTTTPACVVKRNGTLWCTPYDFEEDDLLGTPRLGAHVLRARTGDLFVCALTDEGKVWCEGFDVAGQTGHGTNETLAGGAYVEGLSDVRLLSVNRASACALLGDGSVWCWGAYAAEQRSNVPVLVSGCGDQRQQPQPPVRTAPLADGAQRLGEAGQLRGQAACQCAGLPVTQQCATEHNVAPNTTCLEALAPGQDPYWHCRLLTYLQQAECFATAGSCDPTQPPDDCPQAPTCGERPRVGEIERYCARPSCSVLAQDEVEKHQICDGTVDCLDGTDERNCTPNAGRFACAVDDANISLDQLCDGRADCADGSDEASCATPIP